MYIVHEYQQEGYTSYNNGVGTPTALDHWRGNGAWDPEASAGGGQPNRFDQAANMYNKNQVMWSSIRVKFYTPESASVFRISVFPARTGLSVTSFQATSEQPYSRHRNVFGTAYGNEKSTGMIKHFMTTRKVLGLTHGQMGMQDLQGGPTSNPTYMWEWYVVGQALDLTTSTTVRLTVNISYGTVWYDRKIATIST